MFKIGIGYDIHRLADPEPVENYITLGGIQIPHQKQIIAHSDGDVLIHALIDAMLGALALGDIGQHFPDTDPQYKGCSSIMLLEHAFKLVQKEGYAVSNCDATIIAEKPKMSPYIMLIRENLAKILNINTNQVSVKATTNEQCDATGQQQAIAVHAIALLVSMS